MTSLSDYAGFEVDWAADSTLTFGSDLVVDETFSRPRSRLRSVALQPEACEPADQIQYWMYNGIAHRSDREKLAATGMRYELTLMYPRAIGRERAKTLGHLHSGPLQGALNYPEICEVLSGKAYFVFQTMDTISRVAPFCAVMEVNAGEKVIIPPNLHHLTINASDEPLLFSDVIPLAVKGIYQSLADLHGAAWLYTSDAGWIRNPAYTQVADLAFWSVKDYPALKLTANRPLFSTFLENPLYLDWMVNPTKFRDVFPDIWEQIETALAG
jgi:glucose-6-phosphate isomerase, archaeal